MKNNLQEKILSIIYHSSPIILILTIVAFGTITLTTALLLVVKYIKLIISAVLLFLGLYIVWKLKTRIYRLLSGYLFPALEQSFAKLNQLRKKSKVGAVAVLLLIISFYAVAWGNSDIDTTRTGMYKAEQTKQTIFPTDYNDPRDLFYCIHKKDHPYVTQNLKEHFANNGYLATDIGTNKKEVQVYAPSYMYFDGKEVKDVEIEYILTHQINKGTTGLTAILTHANKQFLIGHMKSIDLPDGTRVKTGDIIGTSGGCKGNLQYGEVSTDCHVHFEYRVENEIAPYPNYMYSLHGDKLKAYKSRYKGATLRPDDPLYSKFTKQPILAKILSEMHQIETGRCSENCGVSQKLARGPMQFIKNTWGEYGCDGNNDEIVDVENIDDSMCGATKYMQYLFQHQKNEHPKLDNKWIWWKALYRYNAGHSTPASHNGGIPSAIRYADNIINQVYK